MQQTSTRAIGQHHPITVQIIGVLETGKPGDFLADAELQKKVGLPVGVHQAGYGYLQSAIRYVERTGIVWKRMPGQNGIKRQIAEEIVERTQNDTHYIARKTRRASTRLLSVDTATLPPQQRSIAMSLAAQLGAIALMSEAGTTKKLSNTGAQPQIGDAMKLFSQ